MCPLCLRADFLTRLCPACDYRPHSLFIAFETRVRSPATNSFPAPTPVQPVIFELARKRASSLCALCVCAQISRRDFVWLGLQTGLFYFWPFKRGCARPQLSSAHPACLLPACCCVRDAWLLGATHACSCAALTTAFVRIARRHIPTQGRAETTIAIKHAAAKTEHAKILVTTHHQAARERVAGDRVAGDRAAGDRAAGDRAAGDRERQATERRTADRACRGRACTRHRFRILCMYFVACVVYWQ